MKRLVPARVVVSSFYAAIAVGAMLALMILAPVQISAATTPSSRVGQQVATSATTNVRATADGKLLGTQPKFALGNITAGPALIGSNAVIWYQVSFVTGASGWVGGDMLVDGIATPKSVVVGKGTSQAMVLDEFGNIEVGFISFDANSNQTYSFSESTNQGLTFSTPSVLPMVRFQVPPPQGPTIAAERNGAIDVVYPCLGNVCEGHFGFQSVQLIRSIDRSRCDLVGPGAAQLADTSSRLRRAGTGDRGVRRGRCGCVAGRWCRVKLQHDESRHCRRSGG